MGLPAIMLGVGLAGAATSAVGALSTGEAQSRNSAYQAQVAANNANIARENAGMETQAGETTSANRELKGRMQIGATKAGQAASGVDVNTGSFVGARAGEAKTAMLDALTIRSNAAKNAWALENQASNYQAQSGLDTAQSQQEASAAPIAATGSLLSGASSVGGNYYRYLNIG